MRTLLTRTTGTKHQSSPTAANIISPSPTFPNMSFRIYGLIEEKRSQNQNGCMDDVSRETGTYKSLIGAFILSTTVG